MSQDRAQRPAPSAPSSNDGRGPAAPGGQAGVAAQTAGTYFLGRYRVVDEIGIGGMASVHLARMDGPGGFQKWVAIKRIHPHLIEDDSFIHMFLDEARIAARISHPNVATVFELGKHDDTYWIAMEYLHGEPLREVMRRTEETGAPMPPEIACRVIADAAEGLHAAHELLGKNGEKLNLIHRDVTPHNLFVTYEGATKVVDFGIAKFSSRMSSTRAGTLKGKLAYMSPEQVQGETIDRRTDIFALGVVLWELTTGQRLFRMDSDLDTLAKVQECNIPRPSTIVRGYPIDLEKIVMKALAKNRGERFKTAREFSRMLQSLLMRRGLFIASDEVANYIQSIFKDRIEKREAHLRWAGEVTQTINVDSIGASPQGITTSAGTGSGDPSFRSDHSDVQPFGTSAPVRQAPRPAAGVPAAPAGASPASSGAIPAAPPSEPRQAPFLPAPSVARPPIYPQGSFPAPPRVQAPRAPAPMAPRPAAAFDPDDAPTLLAPGGAPLAAAPLAGPAGGMGGNVITGFEDDDEDSDDTIVTAAPTEDPSEYHPSAHAAPLPAAGRPAVMPRSSDPPVAPSPLSQPRTLAGFPTGQPDMARDSYPGSPISSGGPRTLPLNTTAPMGTSPFATTQFSGGRPPPLGGARPPPGGVVTLGAIDDPSLPPTQMGPLLGTGAPEAAAAMTANPPVRIQVPTIPRLFAPPTGAPPIGAPTADQTVQLRTQRSAPIWAVAILVVTALSMFVGFIMLVASLFSHSPGTGPSASSDKATGATPSAAPKTPAPAPAPSPTPTSTAAQASPAASASWAFTSARSAFLTALAEAPTGAAPPSVPAPNTKTAEPQVETPAPAATTASAPDPAGAPTAAATEAARENSAPAPTPTPPPAVAAAPAAQPAPMQIPQPQPPAATNRRAAANEGAVQGLISVICIPGCDQVYDNGKLLGASPVFKRAATIGSHKIRLVTSNPHVEKVVSTIVVADSVAIVRESMQ